jgi:fatty acid desaturase
MRALFRHPRGFAPNLLAIAYTCFAWSVGVWLLARPDLGLNAAGVLLTAHGLVYSAYLLHDCAHHAIFAAPAVNDRAGVALSWLNGACIAGYAGLREKHLRHHADRLDVVTFDYRAVLKRAPRWVGQSVLALEWAHVPAVELLMRALMIGEPFVHRTARGRRRVTAVLLVRGGLFVVLALVSIKALLLYALAYLLFLTVLRFMDAFQHTYELFPTRSLEPAPADPRRDRRYEYENTYSNLLSVKFPWLNLLALNFPYHNAHHARPAVPWHDLPKLHRSLFGAADPQVIGCHTLLATYHRHRLARVCADDYGAVSADGDRTRSFIGAVGVSFLTAI